MLNRFFKYRYFAQVSNFVHDEILVGGVQFNPAASISNRDYMELRYINVKMQVKGIQIDQKIEEIVSGTFPIEFFLLD